MNATTPEDDGDLRRLLDDAVSDIHPHHGTAAIQQRAGRPSPTRWLPITLAAAVATVVVIGGGAWLAQRGPSSNPPTASGPSSPDDGSSDATSSQAPAAAGHTVDVDVYYLGATAAGPRLFPEARQVTDATDSDVQVALDEALTGTPKDPDYRNPFKALGVTATATATDGVTIDLSGPLPRPSGMDDQEAQVAVQSLVRTVDAAAKSDKPVTFTVSGEPADDVLGVPTEGASSVTPADDDSALSSVIIASPAQGATVPTTFTVTGRASTFEANVVWELKRGDVTVRHGFTTATECCTLSPYSFTVTAAPGDYTLVVHDTDESDGEGIGTSQDTKDLTVQ